MKLGRRVAICDQVEDPGEAKGIVRREVVETVTPGTVIHDGLLEARRNNYLVALACERDGAAGLAAIDLSTGELVLTMVDEEGLQTEMGRLDPAELLLARSAEEYPPAGLDADAASGPLRTYRDDWVFEETTARDELQRAYQVHSLDGFGLEAVDGPMVRAAGALIAYIGEIRPGGLAHLQPPRIARPGSSMILDEMTRRNLELVEPLRPGDEGATLVSVLDDTVTAMGARALRTWLLAPLVDADAIWARQDVVAELFARPGARRSVRTELAGVSDLERLAGKIALRRVTPRELLALVRSLDRVPTVAEALSEVELPLLRGWVGDLDPMDDVRGRLDAAISPDAPASLQAGGVIREGHSAELDEIRQVRDGARGFIAALQVRERERTGIGSLKVAYNKVFGYYLEVTRANLERVPDDYVRKQTLANAERFYTPELKEWEEKVLGAEDRIAALEIELFANIRGEVAEEIGRLQELGRGLGLLDVVSTLAEVAERRRYVRPEIHTGYDIDIRAGRHPVVETVMPADAFIPNDLGLDEEGRIVILTGPNMAGKSTILRQTGLVQLLAQMGSFVPADSARLPLCDRVFTRVGASDSLARGQSTFMVEMNESAAIVHGATSSSLVLLDEIGRGTSTYDGVSIAWAVTEHLHEVVRAKTIFATHYHELTQLGDLLPRCEEPECSRARGRRGHRLPPSTGERRRRPLLRYPGGSPGWNAARDRRPREGTSCRTGGNTYWRWGGARPAQCASSGIWLGTRPTLAVQPRRFAGRTDPDARSIEHDATRGIELAR